MSDKIPSDLQEENEESNPYPIPCATRDRSPKLQSCARAYIHPISNTQERETNLTVLSKKFNVGYNHLVRVCKGDGWEEMAQELESMAIAERQRELDQANHGGMLARARRELALIESETIRQHESVSKLVDESRRIFSALNKAAPGSADHSRLVSALVTIRKELEHVTGKAAFDSELQDKRHIVAKEQAAVLSRKLLDDSRESPRDGSPIQRDDSLLFKVV